MMFYVRSHKHLKPHVSWAMANQKSAQTAGSHPNPVLVVISSKALGLFPAVPLPT